MGNGLDNCVERLEILKDEGILRKIIFMDITRANRMHCREGVLEVTVGRACLRGYFHPSSRFDQRVRPRLEYAAN